MSGVARARAIAVLIAMSLIVAACGTRLEERSGGGLGVTESNTDEEVTQLDDPVGVGTQAPSEAGSELGTAPGNLADPGTSSDSSSSESDRGGDSPRVPDGTDDSEANAGQTGTSNQDAASAEGSSCDFSGCERSQGVTDSTIKLGFVYFKGADEFYDSFGLGASFGDPKQQVRALVDDLNRRGGISDRKVEAVFAGIDSNSNDPQGEQQRACIELTEDEQVFAALSPGLGPGTFYSCLASHETFAFSSSAVSGDDGYFQEVAPWYQMPSLKGDTRLWHTMVPALVDRGFFGDEAKVGLVVVDQPTFTRISDRIVKPLMADAGVEVADEFRTSSLQAGDLQTETQQAALRFKSNGVTHVLFVPGFGQAFFFMQNAESQNYRPRYEIESNMAPGVLFESGVPDAQLVGSMGLGWRPQFDVSSPDRYAYTEQEERCFAVMRDGGVNATGRSSPATALHYCDIVWSFEAAAKRAGQTLTNGTLLRSLRSLGTSWPSVLTFQSDLSRGTSIFPDGAPDAGWSYRILAYDEPCDCFVYQGGVKSDVGY